MSIRNAGQFLPKQVEDAIKSPIIGTGINGKPTANEVAKLQNFLARHYLDHANKETKRKYGLDVYGWLDYKNRFKNFFVANGWWQFIMSQPLELEGYKEPVLDLALQELEIRSQLPNATLFKATGTFAYLLLQLQQVFGTTHHVLWTRISQCLDLSLCDCGKAPSSVINLRVEDKGKYHIDLISPEAPKQVFGEHPTILSIAFEKANNGNLLPQSVYTAQNEGETVIFNYSSE